MSAQVHISPRIDRQLAALEGQANTPAIAAARARQVIGLLINGISPANTGRMKARPDKRVKNSIKFNLGKGFRLICIREKCLIHVMFVGDHDSCDAWLDRHSKKRPHKRNMNRAVFDVNGICGAPAGSRDPADLPDPEAPPIDETGLGEISQGDLRRVFRGLCAP